MAEYLDDKLPLTNKQWNTMATRELIIWVYHRICKRLEALEAAAGITPLVIAETEPDMNKIKKPKKKDR